MEEITSIESALQINGTTEIPTFSEFKDEKTKNHKLATWQWEEIVKAYNKKRDPDYVADWANWKQRKNYPWVEITPDATKETGFGFSYSYYNYSNADAYVGARLCFATPEDVLEALKKFEQLYIKTLLN